MLIGRVRNSPTQDGLSEVVGTRQGRIARPYLFETTLDTWLVEPHLAEEVFGPLGIKKIAVGK